MAELTIEKDNEFLSITVVENSKYKVLFLNVLNSQPTPLQWEKFKSDLTSSLTNIQSSNQKFAFLIDSRKLGILSLSKIKDFIHILKQYENCIENQLMCSTVIIEARAVKIICGLFLKFYRTKKPLHFLKNKKLCVEKINSYYDGNHEIQTGIDYNDLENFEEN